ncbi:hypothetical protein K466DRAFT_603441 [Polyporus arcularius HHB13444]|uniref:Uncharacterized protein n=1 Tax=Polyporus arcularius HHB13444 TaxID=1314778 RepID=A0A5C3P347_9APHY|nr:hypothetical protein K466DRAFT_603441 [Polyporus arcularius HHB13444]
MPFPNTSQSSSSHRTLRPTSRIDIDIPFSRHPSYIPQPTTRAHNPTQPNSTVSLRFPRSPRTPSHPLPRTPSHSSPRSPRILPSLSSHPRTPSHSSPIPLPTTVPTSLPPPLLTPTRTSLNPTRPDPKPSIPLANPSHARTSSHAPRQRHSSPTHPADP